MVSKSRTVAQQLLRLVAVTWLMVKEFHNITTCAPVPFQLLFVPILLDCAPPVAFASTSSLAHTTLPEARSLRMSDLDPRTSSCDTRAIRHEAFDTCLYSVGFAVAHRHFRDRA